MFILFNDNANFRRYLSKRTTGFESDTGGYYQNYNQFIADPSCISNEFLNVPIVDNIQFKQRH